MASAVANGLDADVLVAAVAVLRVKVNADPASTSGIASNLYSALSSSTVRVGVFDECDYFLGEIATIAGNSFRHLGNFDEASRWFDLADCNFRQTVNPGPPTAQVAYARLAMMYDQRKSERVVEAIPTIIRGFERLGMRSDACKAKFLEAMALKQAGKDETAFQRFEALREDLTPSDAILYPRVLTEIGAEYARNGRYEEAVKVYEQAADAISNGQDPLAAAHLKGTIAETYRQKGELNVAIDCYRLALAEFAKLEMRATVAYYRVITAEALLLANRDREAEWEIRAALPIIDEQGLLSEGVAALALLRESIQRRNLDKNALGEVRDHLRKLA